MTLEGKLLKYAEHNLNVMIIGRHGIGKSTVVKDISKKLNLKFKYYSSSTLDPFAELIGIPVPQENKTIEFYRPKELDEAEFVFFDELNRVTNPRILNTILEIIQFKSINGNPLKNLKMVWCAINPPGDDYQVEDLDPALIDRFHVYVKMKAHIDSTYMKTKMRENVVNVVKKWWEEDLDNEQRRILTPRRLEYIGWMIDNKVPWKDAIPQGHTFPTGNLIHRIKVMENPEEERFVIDKEAILNKKNVLIDMVKKDPQHAIKISDCMLKFNETELFACRDLLENFPLELVVKVGDRKFISRRRSLKNLFISENLDYSTMYPKISEAFKFQEI